MQCGGKLKKSESVEWANQLVCTECEAEYGGVVLGREPEKMRCPDCFQDMMPDTEEDGWFYCENCEKHIDPSDRNAVEQALEKVMSNVAKALQAGGGGAEYVYRIIQARKDAMAELAWVRDGVRG